MGIEVRVPDINLSVSKFTAVPPPEDSPPGTLGSIPFGLSAVRNVGEGVTELILAERDEHGPFVDFYDFCERVDTAALNKRTVEALIKAGGFDTLGHTRRGLLAAYERIIDLTVQKRKQHDMGAMSLFDSMDSGPVFDDRPRIDEGELDKKVKLAFEKEMLGLYISDHPLMGVESALRRRTDATLDEIVAGEEEMVCNLGGRGHRAPAQVDQAGRPHGGLPAGGPAGRGRDHGLPQDHDRARPQARGRRHRHRPGPRGPQGGHPADHGHGGRALRARGRDRVGRSSTCPARRSTTTSCAR